MDFGPPLFGHRAVGDLPDELRVELPRLALDGEELLRLEPADARLHGAVAAVGLALHGRQPVDPPVRAEHGGVLEDVALGPRQPVEPGRDQPSQRVGQVGRARSVQPREQLLQKEGVAAGPVEQVGRHAVVERGHAVTGEGAQQLRRGVASEGIEVNQDRVVPALRRRPALGQCRARGGEHDERQPGRALDQPADQIEHGLVGPVEVRQHHDDRAPAGERTCERQQRADDLVTGAACVDAPQVPVEPQEVEQTLDDPVDRALTRPRTLQRLGHRGPHLATDDVLVVTGLDPAGGLYRAGYRPPHVRLAVRDAAAGQNEGVVTDTGDLGHVLGQTRLAQPGVAEHEQERSPTAVDRQVEGVGQQRDLVVATDQRGPAAVGPVTGRQASTLRHPCRDGRLAPFGGDGAHRAIRDRPAGGEIGVLPDEHLPGFSRRLESLCGVHDVAHRRVVAPGPQGSHQDLARVDAHPKPHVEPQVGRGLAQRDVEPERGPDRPLGVVFMGDRGSEQRQDGVPDDLVDPATELLDVGDQSLEAPVDDAFHVLGVAMFRHGGEADDVGEQDGDHPPLVAAQPQVGAATRAESSTFRDVRAADGAGHPASVWTASRVVGVDPTGRFMLPAGARTLVPGVRRGRHPWASRAFAAGASVPARAGSPIPTRRWRSARPGSTSARATSTGSSWPIPTATSSASCGPCRRRDVRPRRDPR